MMKIRLAALAVLLLVPPQVAGAQTGPPFPQQLNPMVRRTDAGTAAGITVNGFGRVTVPVTTVRFVAYVRGTPDEAGALAAMRAAGIDDPAIGPPSAQFFGVSANDNGRTMLRGTVRNVTQAKLIAIGRAADAYVRAHPGSSVDNVQFFGRLDDCVAAEQRARAAAVADARRRADAIAQALAVAVDRPIDVSEGGGCNNIGDGGDVPIDVGTLTTNLSISERITYAIAPPDGARRRTL